MSRPQNTKEMFLKELERRFPNMPIEIIQWTSAKGAIKYKCLKCKQEYSRTSGTQLYKNKTLCKNCYCQLESITRRKALKLLEEKKNKLVLLSNEQQSINYNMEIRCLNCNQIFNRRWDGFLKNQNCPYCEVVIGSHQRLDISIANKRIQEAFPNDNYFLLKWNGAADKALIKHSCGFVFSKRLYSFCKGRGCPRCYGNSSKGEQEITNFLTEKNIVFLREYVVPELSPLRFDFVFEWKGNRVFIEYQGEQHFYPIKGWGGEEKFKKQKLYDNMKRQYCKQNDYILLEISYIEYSNIQTILSTFLGSTTIEQSSNSKRSETENIPS